MKQIGLDLSQAALVRRYQKKIKLTLFYNY